MNNCNALNSIERLEQNYSNQKIITGSFNLYIRGLVPNFNDIDFIVPGTKELELISQNMGYYIDEEIFGPRGTIYEIRLKIEGINIEVWRETGEDYVFSKALYPQEYELSNFKNKKLMLRPLDLLMLDYFKATRDNDPESIMKNKSYQEKIDIIRVNKPLNNLF
jgi:hypothetical protein